MKVALWCWHAPYAFLLANALPEHTFLSLATPYNRSGWNEAHRPRPENVTTAAHLTDVYPDVVLLQTPQDIIAMQEAKWPGPSLYLSHNRCDLGEREVAGWLNTTSVPLVCISPMKAASWEAYGYKPFSGGTPVILPYVDPDDYEPTWTGEGGYVLTVCNGLNRPLFDKAAWLEATRDLPVKLVGSGNEGIPGAVGPAKDWDELKRYYREARVYLNPTVPPGEDPHNLAFLEARAAGSPWISLRDTATATVRRLLELELMHPPLITADEVREQVVAQFPKDRFAQAWRKVLEEVTK